MKGFIITPDEAFRSQMKGKLDQILRNQDRIMIKMGIEESITCQHCGTLIKKNCGVENQHKFKEGEESGVEYKCHHCTLWTPVYDRSEIKNE